MTGKGGFGLVLIALGIVQMIGAATGNEAAMLGALFQPQDLTSSSGGKVQPRSSGFNSFMGDVISVGSIITNPIGNFGKYLGF